MEWSWRTVLILIGLLGIAVILVDGFRRMKRARAEALRLDIKPSSDIPEDDFNPELPGTVRVVGTSTAEDVLTEDQEPATSVKPSLIEGTAESHANHKAGLAEKKSADKKAKHSPDSKPYTVSVKRKEPTLDSESDVECHESDEHTDGLLLETEAPADDFPKGMFSDFAPAKNKTFKDGSRKSETPRKDVPTADKATDDIPNSPLIPTVKPVDLNEQVPVLLDVEELGDEASFEEGIVSAPRVVQTAEVKAEASHTKVKTPTTEKTPHKDAEPTDTEADKDLPVVEDPDTLNDPHLEEEVEQLPDEALISQPVNYAGTNAEVLANRPDAEMVLVIHTIARDMEGFRGKDLLFLFNSCDLRYGEKDIFHRFEEADGEGCIQFSVAQMHNPGTFDPAQMADQNFGGLSFFMSLPGPKKPLEAYEAMSEMAQVVSRNLKADVLDGSHSAMTPQTMEHERQQILDYERQQRLAAKKQRL